MYNPNRTYEHNNQSREIVINAKDHVAGKLATFVAKNILEGVPVTVVHTENIVFTGPIERGVGRFKDFLNKRKLTNPLRGPFHHRSPAMLFTRIVRRMVPKKKYKGQCALSLLTVHDSCPDDLVATQCMVCPRAMLKYTADPIRRFYYMKDLCSKFGWKYFNEVERQNVIVEEIRRKAKETKEKIAEKVNSIKESDKFKRRVEELMAQIE
ncbi:60S ribosomal protein L13a [Trachipleistophora hominis]|uniref:60S ribosomal protein L13a n=1 Tax=Trachipleistophora hominis TaxID=72359 RepID=L7JZD4_TRAHO|nr:60S ribosomal protein L13a [Trachipleistophora hominis]